MTPELANARIAYLSMEIALESSLPTYSGGLGVLAGDMIRAAADLRTPMVCVTLFYRQGFFLQHLSADGHQTESQERWDPLQYLEPVDVRFSLNIEDREVVVRAWRYLVKGSAWEVPVYLIDSDQPENDPEDRALCGQLYAGDSRYRLKQEVLLGLGGYQLLKELGYESIETFHMNEGHSSLLTIGMLRDVIGDREPAEEDIAVVRSRCVFTTHTPVPAGHDRFPLQLVHEVLGDEIAGIIENLSCCTDELNMTYLGLFFSRYANGVAHRHGEVAQSMYPGYEINSITNGVHGVTWVSDPMAALYDREVPGWRADNYYLRRVLDIQVEHILEAHAQAKRNLLAEVERRTRTVLDPRVMTIGFARRAATYKRADLIFTHMERLKAIAREVGPIQFVFGGKAHPHDDPGKEMIHRVFEAGEHLAGNIPVIYLEEHDMALGKLLTSGVDLWLNNPLKPLEASGTSGMKAALNGVPSFSVLDGWWPEGWIEGVTGWSIGDSSYETDASEELLALYAKLRYTIVPLYYGAALAYGQVMRNAIAINGSYFTTQRMMQQYLESAYRLRRDA